MPCHAMPCHAMPCHEAVVLNSDLDFLLVRPMGIDPAEPQRGSYALLTGRGQGGLEITVAKEDVALLLGAAGYGGYGRNI